MPSWVEPGDSTGRVRQRSVSGRSDRLIRTSDATASVMVPATSAAIAKRAVIEIVRGE